MPLVVNIGVVNFSILAYLLKYVYGVLLCFVLSWLCYEVLVHSYDVLNTSSGLLYLHWAIYYFVITIDVSRKYMRKITST